MHPNHALLALAGAAVTSSLLLASASHAAGQGSPSEQTSRPCFIEPPRWNVALDGPLPRCPLR
jgi:hypothetical protein